jgi:hypothetical protein
MDRKLGEFQDRSGRYEEEKNHAPVVQPVAMPTELSRLKTLHEAKETGFMKMDTEQSIGDKVV